jgi:Rod binding domain-containing protein
MANSVASTLSSYTKADINIAAEKTKAATMDAKSVERAGEAAKEFEAVFTTEMMKPMFDGLDTDGMFGGGKGEEVFRSMLLDEYGKIMAQSDTFGLADQVKQQLIMMQEKANNGS